MSWLNLIGITAALADTPAATVAPHQGNILSVLPMLVIFIVIFYFFMIRPQSKRMREQKELLASIAPGDEVVTSGGVVGKVNRLRDNFIILTISKDNEVVIQKTAITTVLPKGTIDSLG